MRDRVTVDHRLMIIAIEAVTDHAPFETCRDIAPNFQRLVGLRLGPGCLGKVKERVGGRQGFTHIIELLAPIATAAFQTPATQRRGDEWYNPDQPGRSPPRLLDTCHALARDGVTGIEVPEFYTSPEQPV